MYLIAYWRAHTHTLSLPLLTCTDHTLQIHSLDFQGFTGRVQFLPGGDRVPFYDIQNYRNSSDVPIVIGSWGQDAGTAFTIPPEFYNGSTTPPGTLLWLVMHRCMLRYWY
jgi:hypothetical protein